MTGRQLFNPKDHLHHFNHLSSFENAFSIFFMHLFIGCMSCTACKNLSLHPVSLQTIAAKVLQESLSLLFTFLSFLDMLEVSLNENTFMPFLHNIRFPIASWQLRQVFATRPKRRQIPPFRWATHFRVMVTPGSSLSLSPSPFSLLFPNHKLYCIHTYCLYKMELSNSSHTVCF